MTTKKSTAKRTAYKKDIKRCETINELQWIYTDMAQDNDLTVDDFMSAYKDLKSKKLQLQIAGDKYTRATKPTFRN